MAFHLSEDCLLFCFAGLTPQNTSPSTHHCRTLTWIGRCLKSIYLSICHIVNKVKMFKWERQHVQRHQLIFIGETLNKNGYEAIRAPVNKKISHLHHTSTRRQGEVQHLPRRLVAKRISYSITNVHCLDFIFGFDFDTCLYAPGRRAAPTGDIAGRERNILLCNDSDNIRLILNYLTSKITIIGSVKRRHYM